MGIDNVFTQELTLIGIKAPWFTWIGALLILLGVAYYYWKMRRAYNRGVITQRALTIDIRKFGESTTRKPGEGFTGEMREGLDKIFSSHPIHLSAWHNFRATMTRLTHADGRDTYWASESASSAFGENSELETSIDKSLYQSIPGIFTGIGLLLTFVAILVALSGVKKNIVTQQFDGIDQLISGLSGKFISSIAALAAASIYMFLEKPLSHRFEKSRTDLVNAIDRAIPRLNSSQVLVDMHKNMVEQTDSFRLFNADLSTRLQESFSASMEPTLVRMVNSIESLDQFLRASESNKSQSMTDQIKELLSQIEHSMKTTLEKMGDAFSQSLSGSARTEFEQIGKTLSQSTGLIREMNIQFEGTQSAIGSLVEMAKSSTQEQFAFGRQQIEDVTNTLKELMTQLRETSGTSSSQMTAALLHATDMLSSKVTELSDQMSSVVQESTSRAQETATNVIEKAGEWSEKSNRTLSTLLDRLGGHVDQTEQLKKMLDESMGNLVDVLTRYHGTIGEMKRISTDFMVAASTAKEMVGLAKTTQDSMRRTAELSAGQVQKLEDSTESYQQVWSQIKDSMERYQRVFEAVERASQNVLESVTQHLKDYSETTKNHFEGLVVVSNDHLAKISGKISGAIGELDTSIQDLGEILGKINPTPRGRA